MKKYRKCPALLSIPPRRKIIRAETALGKPKEVKLLSALAVQFRAELLHAKFDLVLNQPVQVKKSKFFAIFRTCRRLFAVQWVVCFCGLRFCSLRFCSLQFCSLRFCSLCFCGSAVCGSAVCGLVVYSLLISGLLFSSLWLVVLQFCGSAVCQGLF